MAENPGEMLYNFFFNIIKLMLIQNLSLWLREPHNRGGLFLTILQRSQDSQEVGLD